MDILDAFYSRTYENSINKKMLYYNYNFPKEEVEDYVRQVLNVPIESFIQYDIEAEDLVCDKCGKSFDVNGSIFEYPEGAFNYESLEVTKR